VLRTNRQRLAWTNTSDVPDDEVVYGLRFVAKEVDLDRTVFHFKHLGPRRRTFGRTYKTVPGIANMDGLVRSEWDYLVVVTDGDEWFDTLAHEAKHVEQFKLDLPVREVPARAFAAWADKKRQGR
jgi:hypothetical protein